jgi:ABC-type Na+ transport system ATPase subunit NatA
MQPACRYHVMRQYPAGSGSTGTYHACTALYNPVTGEAVIRHCEDVRGDQMTCGRHGALYEAAEVSIKPQRVTAREDLG